MAEHVTIKAYVMPKRRIESVSRSSRPNGPNKMSPVEQTSAHATRDLQGFVPKAAARRQETHEPEIRLLWQAQSTIASVESRSQEGAKEATEAIGRNNPN